MQNNLKVMEIPKNERPTEKLINFGPDALSNSELLAIILRSGVKGESVLNISQKVLSEALGLDGILKISYDELTAIKGINEVKGAQILAVAELFRRFKSLKTQNKTISVNSPSDIANMLMHEMRDLNQEILKVIVLNTKNNIIRVKDVFKGTLNTSIVHPREIYSEALKCGGASIIICHNHPSGDPTPSKEDINITKRIIECGTILGIKLLDHLVIGDNKFVSLKEKGII